jgi:hypothetical protein
MRATDKTDNTNGEDTTMTHQTYTTLHAAMLEAWNEANGGEEDMPADPAGVLAALDARMLETAGRQRYNRQSTARDKLVEAMEAHERYAKTEPPTLVEDAYPLATILGHDYTERVDATSRESAARDMAPFPCSRCNVRPHEYGSALCAECSRELLTYHEAQTARGGCAGDCADCAEGKSYLEGLAKLVEDVQRSQARAKSYYTMGNAAAAIQEADAVTTKLMDTLRAWLGMLPASLLQDVPAATLELAGMALERDGSSYRSGQPGAVALYKLVNVDTSAGDPAKRILPDYSAADGSGALVMLPGTMLPNGAVVVAASAAHAHRWIVLAMRPGFHASGTYATWHCSRPGDGRDTTSGHYSDTIHEAAMDYAMRCKVGY